MLSNTASQSEQRNENISEIKKKIMSSESMGKAIVYFNCGYSNAKLNGGQKKLLSRSAENNDKVI